MRFTPFAFDEGSVAWLFSPSRRHRTRTCTSMWRWRRTTGGAGSVSIRQAVGLSPKTYRGVIFLDGRTHRAVTTTALFAIVQFRVQCEEEIRELERDGWMRTPSPAALARTRRRSRPPNRRRSPMTRRRVLTAAIAVCLGIAQRSALVHAATCTGATPCNACKNCRSCAHCGKRGGTCGVCQKKASHER